jgi:lysozyme
LTLSTAGLVGIAMKEQFRGEAYIPVPGDRPTIGFGSAGPDVRLGQTITVERALILLEKDVSVHESGLRACTHDIPMYQHEWDVYVAWTFNVGVHKACTSTLVKKLRAGDYEGACNELLRWNKFNGRELRGLTKLREEQRQLCLHGRK